MQNNLDNIIKNSHFNKDFYSVNISLLTIIDNLNLYAESLDDRNQQVKIKSDLDISPIVPEFQRENNKWSKSMQVHFVENLICGLRSEITLYNINCELYTDCMILDGLQRLTAIISFIKGEFKIFNEFYYEDIEKKVLRTMYGLSFKIYKFNNEHEAVQFYIKMNKNITHSEEDIIKAEVYLNNLNK